MPELEAQLQEDRLEREAEERYQDNEEKHD